MDKLFDRIKKQQKENDDLMTDIERRDYGPWVIRKKKEMYPEEFIIMVFYELLWVKRIPNNLL